MFFKGLLIIANLVGGFVASSTYIVSKIPKLSNFSKKLNIFKIPIGIIVFLISFINIFNISGRYSYPKLSLISGLLIGLILSIKLLDKTEIDKETKTKLFSLANKLQNPVGLAGVIIGLLSILDILTDVISYLL